MEIRNDIYLSLRFQILPVHVGGNTKVSRENVTVRFRDICQEPPRRVKNRPSLRPYRVEFVVKAVSILTLLVVITGHS